jgi:O-antigen/teichoic acid export membrane protein
MKKFSVFILFLIFLNFILLNNFALNQKIFLLDLERKKYFCLKILESSAKYIFPVIIYSYFRTLESLLCGIVFGYGIAYIVLIYFLRNMKFYFLIKIKNIKKYISFAYPIIFVSIFTWGISFSDRYFVEYYRGTKEVAIYSLLAMVAGIGSIIGRVYFMYAEPKILKNYEKNSNETFQMLNRYLKFLIGVFLSLFLFAYFIPKEIYSILLEKDLVNNTYYFNTMMILLVATFVNILHIAHHMYLKLLHKLNILAYILFIAFIVNLFGNFFIKKYGILVGAVSTLTAYCVILILQVIYVNIYLKKYDV